MRRVSRWDAPGNNSNNACYVNNDGNVNDNGNNVNNDDNCVRPDLAKASKSRRLKLGVQCNMVKGALLPSSLGKTECLPLVTPCV